jgi:hypothetical protein
MSSYFKLELLLTDHYYLDTDNRLDLISLLKERPELRAALEDLVETSYKQGVDDAY